MKHFIFALLVSILFLSLAQGAFADGFGVTIPNPLCLGGPGSANCIDNFPTLIQRITDYIFGIIGILATLMFVVAGIFFVTSAGSPERVGRAKRIALYAAVGLAIALVGEGLVRVIQEVLNVQ